MEGVTLSQHLGGLGIKDLAVHNKCMSMKWHWRFNQDDAGLWKEILQPEYGRTSHWLQLSLNSLWVCIVQRYHKIVG